MWADTAPVKASPWLHTEPTAAHDDCRAKTSATKVAKNLFTHSAYTTLQKQELGRDFAGEAKQLMRVENDLAKKAYVLPWLEHLNTAFKELGKLAANFEGAL